MSAITFRESWYFCAMSATRRLADMDAKQKREIATAAAYLKAAEDEYNSYHTKNNLAGRALLDCAQRARLIYEDALKGIAFKDGGR
jgi:hypothetical protein